VKVATGVRAGVENLHPRGIAVAVAIDVVGAVVVVVGPVAGS